MIFITCSTVTPGFGVRIVSTPVIFGRGGACGGAGWPCAMGARTIPNASSRYNISIFIIVELLRFLTEIGVLLWYPRVPHTSKTQERGESFRTRSFFLSAGRTQASSLWYYTVPETSRRGGWLRHRRQNAVRKAGTKPRCASASLRRPLRR